eukprot:jgi/Undpi1/2750/HiC_scaffold_14.g06127.m1
MSGRGFVNRRHALARQQQQLQRSGVRTRAGKAMALMMSAETDVVDGDIVVVVGASGGVGRLVTQSLAATGKYKVRGLVRNLEKAKEALADGEGLDLELVQGNIVDEESLNSAMKVLLGGKLKRFVLLSSVGVERADKFPFVILNAFGVLDAKAKGEEAVRRAAEEGGFSFSIVRPGQIKGEPFTTYSAKGARSTAVDTEGPSGKAPKRMVSLRPGDNEAGDVNPSSVAAVFTQAVGQPGAAGKSFTVVNVLGTDPTQGQWDTLFSEL